MYTALALLMFVGISFLMMLVGPCPSPWGFSRGGGSGAAIPTELETDLNLQGAAAGAVLYHCWRRQLT